MEPNSTTTDETNYSFSAEELRKAALLMIKKKDEKEERYCESIAPIPKRLFSALVEHAFPDAHAHARGLAYPEEMSDIADWLTDIAATDDPDRNREETLIATAGAWAEWACDHHVPEFRDAHRDLLRAIAIFFLRDYAWTVADCEVHNGEAEDAS